MISFSDILGGERARWLVTGAAGFIGSNLVEALLREGQEVVGLDNFATGHQRNLDEVHHLVGREAWARFRFIKGDIRDMDACKVASDGVQYVLHQAALGSVPRSLAQPLASFDANVDGFVKVLTAARDAGVRRFVYASSSSVYGDSPDLPKVEGKVGKPLSPYAATKCANELFADVWARSYSMSCTGLRYFNVFGARQDPDGPYAAVIPKWVSALLGQAPCFINGDGQTSRDFCYVANAIQANLRAARAEAAPGVHQVFNVACGESVNLLRLFELIRASLGRHFPEHLEALERATPSMREFRAGDVRHSLAAIDKGRQMLGFEPTHSLAQGLDETASWFARTLSGNFSV